MEKIVLVVALLGSVLYLFDKIVSAFGAGVRSSEKAKDEKAAQAAAAKQAEQEKALGELKSLAEGLLKVVAALQQQQQPQQQQPQQLQQQLQDLADRQEDGFVHLLDSVGKLTARLDAIEAKSRRSQPKRKSAQAEFEMVE
jgi:predicted  nucleic acid-binding Zn-ribbon protein